MEAALSKPPKDDEIEVSLFGPGYGECVVLHLGRGEWIVVDSFRDSETEEPVALKYLNALGVDPAVAIRRIIATHWDDDHIDGLANVLRAASSAEIAISGAFSSDEFRSLIANWVAEDSIVHESGVNQIKEIRKLNPPLILASEKTLVYERFGDLACSVRALSPSHEGVVATMARLFPHIDQFLSKRIPRIEGNDASVVLSIEVAGRLILLGGDLEVRANRKFGWLRIVDAHLSSGRPKHEIFKVPHHGSANGDHDEIWIALLEDNPSSLISPFVRGGTKLPSEKDRDRIRKRTINGFLTAPPVSGKFRHPNPMVQKTMKETAELLEYPRKSGHVRLRSKSSNSTGSWTREFFGAAEDV